MFCVKLDVRKRAVGHANGLPSIRNEINVSTKQFIVSALSKKSPRLLYASGNASVQVSL